MVTEVPHLAQVQCRNAEPLSEPEDTAGETCMGKTTPRALRWQNEKRSLEKITHLLDTMPAEVQRGILSGGFLSEQGILALARRASSPGRLVRRACTARRNAGRKRSLFAHFIFHKPRSCFSQPNQFRNESGCSVWDVLPVGYPRGLPIAGRLDSETSGLVLFTDNGLLLNRIANGSGKVCKRYMVTCRRQSAPEESPSADWVKAALGVMRAPFTYANGKKTQAAVSVRVCGEVSTWMSGGGLISESKFEFIISEGRNRQVRRLCGAAGLKVEQLVRTGLGPLQLTGLEVGQARGLTHEEICKLYLAAGALGGSGSLDIPDTIEMPCTIIDFSTVDDQPVGGST